MRRGLKSVEGNLLAVLGLEAVDDQQRPPLSVGEDGHGSNRAQLDTLLATSLSERILQLQEAHVALGVDSH